MFYKYVIKQWFISFIKKLLFLSVNNVTKYDQFFGFICAGNTKQNISFPLSSRTSPFTRRLICKSQIWSNDKERTCSEQKKCWIVINLCFIYKHLHAHLWTINLHVVKSQVVTLNDIFYVHIRFIVLSIFISDKNNKMCMQRNISDTWVTILELNFHTFINIYSFTRVLHKR